MIRRLMLILLALPVTVAALASLVLYLAHAVFGTSRAWRVAIAHDQALNAALGGSEDETISSRAGKSAGKARWACVLCKLLDKVDPGHCTESIERDEGKPFPGD